MSLVHISIYTLNLYLPEILGTPCPLGATQCSWLSLAVCSLIPLSP